MRKSGAVFLFVLGFSLLMTGERGWALPPAAEVVDRVKAVYAKHCCFKAFFKQLTVNVAMDLRERFEGVLFVKKPSFIALDVKYPENQKVVVRGRKYAVYFPEEGNSVQGECPPGLNVEHFIGFFANVGHIDANFKITYPPDAFRPNTGLIMLELNEKGNVRSTYRVVIGVDSERYTIRRAIIYDALGNYNRFDLSSITFLESIPDEKFHLNLNVPSEPGQALVPILQKSVRD